MSEIITGEDPVIGRPATAEEELVVAISDEAAKQAIPRLNDALSRLVTLSTAMTGGALAALKDDVCTGWGRVGAAALFFFAVAAAVIGSLPYLSTTERELTALTAEVESAIWWKKWATRICCGFLALGALVAVIGAAARVAQ